MISGIITAVLLLSFLGIAAWAWSGRNRRRFADAAALPLTDDAPVAAACCSQTENKTGGRA